MNNNVLGYAPFPLSDTPEGYKIITPEANTTKKELHSANSSESKDSASGKPTTKSSATDPDSSISKTNKQSGGYRYSSRRTKSKRRRKKSKGRSRRGKGVRRRTKRRTKRRRR